MTRKKKIGLGILGVLLIAQFIRPNRSVPTVDTALSFDEIHASNKVATDLIKDACYDCHSYEREYPMYAEIAPVSWWIQGHVNGGTQHLNYSEWGNYDSGKAEHKIEEMIEEIQSGHMPPKSFKWLHPEAKWTDEQKTTVISFLKSL